MITDFIQDYAMVIALLGVFAAVIVFVTDRFPVEMVSAGILAAGLVFFHFAGLSDTDGAPIGPDKVLAGLANPALITILALLIIGQGMFQTGALDGPTRRLGASYEQRPTATLISMFGLAFVTSAFLNNTPVVVMFLPILSGLAARSGVAASWFLMPLSFVCILAGQTTLIGSSTNLLVANAFDSLPDHQIDFFDPTPYGLILAAVGIAYLAIAAPRLLPDTGVQRAAEVTASGGRQFVAPIEIGPGHPLLFARPAAGMFAQLAPLTVRLIQRGQEVILPPFEDIELRVGDTVVVAATRNQLTALFAKENRYLHALWASEREIAADPEPVENLSLAEVVVAPGSRLTGRSIGQAAFRYQTGCVLVGVQRRARMARDHMDTIRLEPGDVLLVLGSRRSLRGLRGNRDVLPLEWSETELPKFSRAPIAQVIFLAVVAAAALKLLPIVTAATLGATAMIASGCLNVRQAARAIDRQIFLLIGASFVLALALESTGAASLIARLAVDLFAPFGPAAFLSALFLIVALLTNVLSNAATAVLFAPLAARAYDTMAADPFYSAKLDGDPTLFVLTVLFAANCSYATPIAYQTNLLVMGPGGYKFSDFVRLGAPLAALMWLTFTGIVLARYGWG